jgi:hypothetical protein
MLRLTILLILISVLVGLTSCTRRSAIATAVAQTENPGNTKVSSSTKTNVSFKGVIFTFDPSLAADVRAETIPAKVDGKPADIHPEHSGFTFIAYPRLPGLPPNETQLRIFPLNKFREALTTAGDELSKSFQNPKDRENWGNYLDEEVRILKSLLAKKPQQASLGRFLAKARGEQGCRGAMPFLPLWEGCQAFVARTRFVKFGNGEGVFFLTQWDRETSQVTNEWLEYAFQGITYDGRYYVDAERFIHPLREIVQSSLNRQ